MRAPAIALVLLFGCTTHPHGHPPGDDDGMMEEDEPVADPCATPVSLPVAGRPVDLMPASRLAEIASRVPCIAPGSVRATIESPRTFWYDKHSLTPGYQDSFGDNVIAPIGMRPNTIDPGLINLAVPGGHEQIFVELGTFHFPFGRPIGNVTNVEVIDFWQPPDSGSGVLPVVHWRRDPNENTHRIEWMFPAGTVFGELLFVTEGSVRYPFEIRTRTRTLDGWQVDVYRPFPRASELADAIEERRQTRPAWTDSPTLDALVAQLRTGELASFRVSATHFPGAFAARDAGREELPALAGTDAELVHELMVTTPFRSARGLPWKESNGLVAWSPGAAGAGTIAPKGYNAAAIQINETSCDSCHRDAGRPFMTWYDNILAYGELWGNDEIFTWHPFTLAKFVDASGKVVNFNYDNRQIRPDFVAAGLVEPYAPANHPPTLYQRIVREWTDFHY